MSRTKVSIETESSNRIYYNVLISQDGTNGNQAPTPVSFSETLNTALLDDPNNYYLSLIRMNIPMNTVPILIMPIKPYPNTDINKTIFTVTLSYKSFTASQPVIYFPTDLYSQTPNPLSASAPLQDFSSSYYYVYTYQAFINMINSAYALCFTALSAAASGAGDALPTGSLAPYIIYLTDVYKVAIIATIAGYDNALSDHIKIWMSSNLDKYFDGIECFNYGYGLPTFMDTQYIVENNHNNYYTPPSSPDVSPATNLYYIMEQQYQALTNWNALQSVQVRSNLLALSPEYVPVTTQFDTGNNNSQGQLSGVGILTDFVPDFNNQVPSDTRTNLQYNSTVYRAIDIRSTQPVTRVDLIIYWTDVYNIAHVLTMYPNTLATFKLLFIRKNTYLN